MTFYKKIYFSLVDFFQNFNVIIAEVQEVSLVG